ncbi:MAG: hypothetical protein ACKO23_01465 [Gemmataceae bacterium]
MFRIPLPWSESSLLIHLPWENLTPWIRVPLLAAILFLPLLLVILLYRYELRLVPKLTAFFLFLIRLSVIFLVSSLICLQPILAQDRNTDRPGKVLVALDLSESMNISDPFLPAARKLKLAHKLGLVGNRVPESVFSMWISEHEKKRDPEMLLPSEKGLDPVKTRRLQEERQAIHDQLIDEVGKISRSELIGKLLTSDRSTFLDRLREKHDIRLIGFHKEGWDIPMPSLHSIQESNHKTGAEFTDLSVPLGNSYLGPSDSEGRHIGVVLFTDGQHNFGNSPTAHLEELKARGIPVYPVMAGSLKNPPDALITSVRGPDYTVFKDVEALIEVRGRITGLSPQEFLVQIHREGDPTNALASKKILYDGEDRSFNEKIPVRMSTPGTNSLIASIRPIDPNTKEFRKDNNQRTALISVADDRAKILILEGEPRWEYHYLTTALARDRLVDLKNVLFEQPRLNGKLSGKELDKLGLPDSSWPAESDGLSVFQCVILGDVDALNLPLSRRKELEEYVADSAGTLIILSGRRAMPMGYPELSPEGELDPLRRLLPIESPRIMKPAGGLTLTLGSGARESRFMEMEDNSSENEQLWAGTPRPWGMAIGGKAKPGASVLAFWADPKDAKLAPGEAERASAVVSRQNYGFGRVVFLGMDGSWRWRYKVGDTYHHRFWGQLIRWAAADRPLVSGNSFIRFGTPKPVYRPGEDVELIARLSNNLGQIPANLAAGARIFGWEEGKIKSQPMALVPLEKRVGQPRILQSRMNNLPPGKYSFEVLVPEFASKMVEKGKEDKQPLATFEILAPDSKELIEVAANESLLQELAQKSGGELILPENLDQLEDRLVKQRIVFKEHHEQKVWQWWGFLALAVGLLTIEWGLRKTAGLP